MKYQRKTSSSRALSPQWLMNCIRSSRELPRRLFAGFQGRHSSYNNIDPLGFFTRFKRYVRKFLRHTRPTREEIFVPDPNSTNAKLSTRQLLDPISWCSWIRMFAFHWLFSRPYASLVAATPVIAAMLALCTVTLLSTTDYSQSRANRYRLIFDQSIRSQDFDTASVVLKDLIQASPQNTDLLYQQALLLHIQAKTQSAIAQMDRLATDRNHGLASMWMVSHECDLQKLKSWSKSDHARFRKLMEIGLNNLDGENLLSAKTLMFSYLAEVGAYGDAARFLADVIPARPELALAAATLCKSQHDDAGTAKYAMIAENYFEEQLSQNPNDINSRINLARVLMIQTQFEKATKLLNDGLRITKDNRLKGIAGEALLVWSNYLGASADSSKYIVKRMQILHAGICIAPSDPLIASAIAQLIIDCRNSRAPEVVRLKEAMLTGTDPVPTHFIRGTMALLDNQIEDAKTQLELALENQPNTPAILNNLAVALAGTQENHLEQALSLVDIALEKQPDHAYFLETRGQILLKLQRWPAAISDLEAALKATELRPSIYPSLAIAYERTGDRDLTQLYKKLASQTIAN